MTITIELYLILLKSAFCLGVIYLIYLLIRKMLTKTGKLSVKLDIQIHLGFWGILILLGIVLYSFKDQRTASRVRLESIAKVKLPDEFKVIKDEYQDMWQDYNLIYEIQFDSQGSKEFINSIKSSPLYLANFQYDGVWQDASSIPADSEKAAWLKSPTGYSFYVPPGRTIYFITFDTLTGILRYNESHD